jgi:fatty-acyl-CoA synthase/long-chain acyl-CoA synthetase
MTYRELERASRRCAHALRRHGVGRGDRVALLVPNTLDYLVADAGIIHAGAAWVGLNELLSEREMHHIVSDSGARVAFVAPEFFAVAEGLRATAPALELVVALGPRDQCPPRFVSWNDFQASESEGPLASDARPDDPGCFIYTGGTTGAPKGVVHTQRGLAVNAYAHVIEMGLQDDEQLLLMTPLPHSAGYLLRAGLLKGATCRIDRKFDARRALEWLCADGTTLTFLVPTMIYRMLDEAVRGRISARTLRTILYGAAPIAPDALRRGLELFGPVFMQLYGQSEAPNFITRLTREDHRVDDAGVALLASAGQAATMVEVHVVDEAGQEVARGEEGEIIARTPYTMREYHGQPEETARSLRDGWLYTGDVGKLDDAGYLYLLDRKKDVIISGGMNVYTTAVEAVIQQQPGVRQVAVIGVPHADWGESVLAFIVPDLDAPPSVDDVLARCRPHLSKYECPKDVRFVASLPQTPFGKIDKKALRAPFWAGQTRRIH